MTCLQQPDGTFTIEGITLDELSAIEDAIVEMFNRSTNRHFIKQNSEYRRFLLGIYRAVSAPIDLIERQKALYDFKLPL